MKVAVCVKQVPDSWAEKKMVNGVLDREGVDAVLNDLDEYAVEEALRIVEAHGGNEEGGAHSVTIISMGPERATEAIRKALSMGANDAILVSDAALAGSDALATSKVLAEVIKSGGFDLVLCGTESTDARMSVVPAMLAQRLGWAQLTLRRWFQLIQQQTQFQLPAQPKRALMRLMQSCLLLLALSKRLTNRVIHLSRALWLRRKKPLIVVIWPVLELPLNQLGH